MFETLPFAGNIDVVKENYSTGDIIRQIEKAHKKHATEYDAIADYFNASDPEAIAKKIFVFIKKNIPYRKEVAYQSSRSPGAIMRLAKKLGADCKHYSLFAGGILDSLNRKGNKINFKYRFATYDNDRIPKHVFIVINDQGREIWLDPVLDNFDSRNPSPTFYFDKKITMPLTHISGLGYTAADFQRSELLDSSIMPGDNSGLDAAREKIIARKNILIENGGDNYRWLYIAGGALLLYFILKKKRK